MKGLRKTVAIEFDDDAEALAVFGPGEDHLNYLKKQFPVSIKYRGNEVMLEGPARTVGLAAQALGTLRDLAKKGALIQMDDVVSCARAVARHDSTKMEPLLEQDIIIASHNKSIYPRTIGQKLYVDAILKHDMVFGVGPAGTGKTYLAMAVAMSRLLKGEVERIILTRPAVEAGERLGFLPGDLVEKVNPYLRPLYDAMHDMVDHDKGERMLASGQIEIAPLAFMRGRTLNDSCVILDEAQNCTREQMKMFLTRLGLNSRAVITGDVTQVDLPPQTKSGLISAVKLLSKIQGIHIHFFDERDVVRHPLVAEIIKAYDQANRLT